MDSTRTIFHFLFDNLYIKSTIVVRLLRRTFLLLAISLFGHTKNEIRRFDPFSEEFFHLHSSCGLTISRIHSKLYISFRFVRSQLNNLFHRILEIRDRNATCTFERILSTGFCILNRDDYAIASAV